MAAESNRSMPVFSASMRQQLVLELASRDVGAGISVPEIHEEATRRGDTASREAYHNIARRLVHRALLEAVPDTAPTRFRTTRVDGSRYLEDDELALLVDPDYPLTALPIWTEAARDVHRVPEEAWVFLRNRLEREDAQALFRRAIVSYADELDAQCRLRDEHVTAADQSRADREIEQAIFLLRRLCRFGLGLSREAIDFPENPQDASRRLEKGLSPVSLNAEILAAEIARRIEPTTFVTSVGTPVRNPATPLIGAVDGSSRMGALTVMGEDGDQPIGYAPLVSINTAIGQVNREVRQGKNAYPAFVRLPERPEDVQRAENRHSIMAKLLYPDLSESEYMHAVWNAMDLLETRATLRLMATWATQRNDAQVPPATIVLRDGTVTPQDRDWAHYRKQNGYGRICRDLIETSWHVVTRAREDERTVVGVVKEAQLFVYAPVLNWFAAQIAADDASPLADWPLPTFNHYPDQLLLTRLLSAGRSTGEPWSRTCATMRPFHAVSSFSPRYSRRKTPAQIILEQFEARHATDDEDFGSPSSWWTDFQGARDPYVKHLQGAQYASFFIAALPRMERANALPRYEILVPVSTDEDGESPWPVVARHLEQLIGALVSEGFDVAAEHSMFASELKLDILPRPLIRAHETVKIWAAELMGRVQEFVRYHVQGLLAGRAGGYGMRPFTRQEYRAFLTQMQELRERHAGKRPDEPQ